MKINLIFALILLMACSKEKNKEQPQQNKPQKNTQIVESPKVNNNSAINEINRPSPPDHVTGKIGDKQVEISYSQPAVRGREIWGKIVPYNEVWRTGANEATVISFNADVKIEGKKLHAGKYALFTIPKKDTWTVIFNKVYEQWGAFKYDAAEDALRVEVSPQNDSLQERLKFSVENNSVVLRWEKKRVAFRVE